MIDKAIAISEFTISSLYAYPTIKILTGLQLTIRLANWSNKTKSTIATYLNFSAYWLSRHKQAHHDDRYYLRSDYDKLIAKYVDTYGGIDIRHWRPSRSVGIQNKVKIFDNVACSKNKSNRLIAIEVFLTHINP